MNLKPNIVIVGSSGHASVVIDIIEKAGIYNIVGLLDLFKMVGDETLGYPILGKAEDILALTEKYQLFGGIIAIGDNWIRKQEFDKIFQISPNFRFVSAIHPSAQIARGVEIGDGTAIMAGAIINSHTKIGKFAVINTAASIDHDCEISDFASVAPGVILAGCVKIGEFTAVGLGAKIIEKITIGNHSLVGAGSVVLKNIGDNSVVFGVPAKKIRDRKIGEKYLK